VEYASPSLQPLLRERLRAMGGRPDRALLCFSHYDEAHLLAGGLRVPRLSFGARYISGALTEASAPEAVLWPPRAGAEAGGVPSPPAVDSGPSRQEILLSRLKLALGNMGSELVWQLLDDLCIGIACPYRFVSYETAVDWSVLATFRAGVFIPWNWELITFLEWYALSIPVFVSGSSWTLPLIQHHLHANPRITTNGSQFNNLRAEWAIDGETMDGPLDAAEIARWWTQTDYVRLPHVRQFAHLADLLWQVADCDFQAWSASLRYRDCPPRCSLTVHAVGRADGGLIARIMCGTENTVAGAAKPSSLTYLHSSLAAPQPLPPSPLLPLLVLTVAPPRSALAALSCGRPPPTALDPTSPRTRRVRRVTCPKGPSASVLRLPQGFGREPHWAACRPRARVGGGGRAAACRRQHSPSAGSGGTAGIEHAAP
ncbi:unnamed protein product, partial [Prorocentrum cordatum]